MSEKARSLTRVAIWDYKDGGDHTGVGCHDGRGLRSNHYKHIGTRRTEKDSICATWDNWWGPVAQCWGHYIDGDIITCPSADSLVHAPLPT